MRAWKCCRHASPLCRPAGGNCCRAAQTGSHHNRFEGCRQRDGRRFFLFPWSFAADKTDVSKKEPYLLLKLFVEPEMYGSCPARSASWLHRAALSLNQTREVAYDRRHGPPPPPSNLWSTVYRLVSLLIHRGLFAGVLPHCPRPAFPAAIL